MSTSKSLLQLENSTLGCFRKVPPSEELDHLIRYLSTFGGSDKLFMVIQYTAKVLVPLLAARARLQYRAGLRKDAISLASGRLQKLYALIGDARTLWRLWGLLPIVQWMVSLERIPPPTRRLQLIERLQGWAMLTYYPLEHFYYLVSHDIVPATITVPAILGLSRRSVRFNAGRVAMWSTRAWAAYVVLQLLHLKEDSKLLRMRAKALSRGKSRESTSPASDAEERTLEARWLALRDELIVNLGYLPLTIHWSLQNGLFSNDAWVGIFGLIAAAASFHSGWRATALPSNVSVPSSTVIDVPIRD